MTFAATTGLTRNSSYGRNQNNVEYLNHRLVLGPVSNFVVLLVLTWPAGGFLSVPGD